MVGAEERTEAEGRDPPTCGKGLAAHAPLPRNLGELIDSVAEVLDLHRGTLDPADESSRAEHAAYAELVERHRRIARELTTLADRMVGYRDLPMGRHDEAALADPRHLQAFARFVRFERELLGLLQRRLAEDESLLTAMGGEPTP